MLLAVVRVFDRAGVEGYIQAPSSVTRLGDFLKVLGDKFSYLQNKPKYLVHFGLFTKPHF